MWVRPHRRLGHVCGRRRVFGALAIIGAAAIHVAAQSKPPLPAAKDREAVIARAQRELELAEIEMRKVSAPTQATVLLGLGRTYSGLDKKKSVAFLKRAYDLALHLNEAEAPGIEIVQNDAVTELARVAPERVEQNMPADPHLRDAASGVLVRHYADRHAFDRVVELLQTMEDPDWVAQDLLMQFDDNDERNQIFGIVLESYRRRGFVAPGRGTDMGTLLVRFWRDLRPELVNEAADELLREARPDNEHARREAGLAITASSPDGAVAFKDFYEFRLFQLLPILKVTDPVRADALLREDAHLKELLGKFPDGQQSLDPTMRDTPLKDGENSKVRMSIVRAGRAPSVAARNAADQVVNAIAKSAADSPQEALERAKGLGNPQLRVGALVAVARQTVTLDPVVARGALKAVMEEPKASFVDVAKLFLQLKDADDARKAVERGMESVDSVYKQDADPDDPNEAIRLLWPSVQYWRDLIDVANTIAPDYAVALVDGLPDAESKPLERTFLTGRWLGIAPWASTSPFLIHNPKK